MSENGYISADGQLQATTPTAFPYQDDHPVIAPFWADAARSSSQGAVYYRETTDSTLLAQAEYYILLSNGGSFSPTSLFIVTWDGVGHEPDDFTEVSLVTLNTSFYTISICYKLYYSESTPFLG